MDLTAYNNDIWWNMLIKFSKQIENAFARKKTTNNAKVNLKPTKQLRWSFSPNRHWLQKRTQNLAIHGDGAF